VTKCLWWTPTCAAGSAHDFSACRIVSADQRADADVPIEETIKATSINNLHFLPSGRLPVLVGILDSQRMRELVRI
jgi:hypothetical protein